MACKSQIAKQKSQIDSLRPFAIQATALRSAPMSTAPEFPAYGEDDPIARRMTVLGVRQEDIEESFVRSGGHGGQNVNKTSTCVMLVHRPTGTQVKCQT